MTEVVIISGKGGTGKTSLTGAFAHLAPPHVLCDLDVDAPDLHLIVEPRRGEPEDFWSGHEAVIDPEKCTQCGVCEEMCRYGAVRATPNGPVIDSLRCEGCKVCVHFCPDEAIAFREKRCGQWFSSTTRFGPMVHAQLFPGEENSGRLVALLRQKARELADSKGIDFILCDGTPGIGCPVISSLTGTDAAVVITEPTPSGRHDLERVMDLCAHFRIPVGVIINKSDLNAFQTGAIRKWCAARNEPVLAELPYDPAVTEAMVQGKVVTEYSEDGISVLIRDAWRGIEGMVKDKTKDKNTKGD